ncbi:MAG: YdjY domain-containing protein [Luteolibacter sp.]
MNRISTTYLILLFALANAHAQEHGDKKQISDDPAPTAPSEQALSASANLQEVLSKLDLPGIKVNLEEWSVDIDASISLQAGLLELIACTKDTKEHESIVVVEARPSHIHTALLLLGAKPGKPASNQIVGGEGPDTRFIEIPPRGQRMDVYLIPNPKQGIAYPIHEFIMPAAHHDARVAESNRPKETPKPKFIFAGSRLHGGEDIPKFYVADRSGSVVSLATFGDELICLDGVHDSSNDSLIWEANPEKLPQIGNKVILRLKPAR